MSGSVQYLRSTCYRCGVATVPQYDPEVETRLCHGCLGVGPSAPALAAAERRRRIAELQACECEWPLRVLRNGCGHDPACPAFVPLGGRFA